MEIKRRFIDISIGSVHYYVANESSFEVKGLPVILMPASPFSARVLNPLTQGISKNRTVFAFDHLGQGDSCSPDHPAPDISYFSKKLIECLDRLEIEKADFYGTHTGAHLVMDLAINFPNRVNKIILDGIGLPSKELKDKYINNLMKPIPIDHYGSQWLWSFQIIKDMYCFFPYFERDSSHRRVRSLPSADELHDRALDLLKNSSTYHLAYIAAFKNNQNGESFSKITVPTLLTGASKDVSIKAFEKVAKIIPKCDPIPYPENIEPGDFVSVSKFLCGWLDK